ncbi:MAG: GAF domain-containing protein [Candidatus Omnitrophica bacterium]|nr:GAF domain-containing protein [Candidatus Omnitrophota bacterium]
MADGPSTWETLSKVFESSLKNSLLAVKKQLRDLTVDASREVGSLESSILIPDENPELLRFFVSVNKTLENESPTVPIVDSLVGYVFQTGQLIAVDKPEDYYKGVDELTGTETQEYIAIPLFHQSRILGVQTFMNRPKGGPTGSFSPAEIQSGQNFATLAAVILRYYERLEFLHQMTLSELDQVVVQSATTSERGFPLVGTTETSHLFMELIQKLEGLSPGDLDWVNELVEVGLKQLDRPKTSDLEF